MVAAVAVVALGLASHRLHRAGLPKGAAVGMGRDGRSFRRSSRHAHTRHREGGERKGENRDDGGPKPAHDAYDYRGTSLKVK